MYYRFFGIHYYKKQFFFAGVGYYAKMIFSIAPVYIIDVENINELTILLKKRIEEGNPEISESQILPIEKFFPTENPKKDIHRSDLINLTKENKNSNWSVYGTRLDTKKILSSTSSIDTIIEAIYEVADLDIKNPGKKLSTRLKKEARAKEQEKKKLAPKGKKPTIKPPTRKKKTTSKKK